MSLDQHNTMGGDPLAETNIAHDKGVNGLTLSSDGFYLVSLGLDEKIRLWDTYNGRNMLVNYGSVWRNRFKSNIQATVSDNNVWPPLLYVPSNDRQVLVFELYSGQLSKRLKGAYGRVVCVENRPCLQELYSGSNDCEILVWEPASYGAGDLQHEQQEQQDQVSFTFLSDDQFSLNLLTLHMKQALFDAWSDSEADEDE